MANDYFCFRQFTIHQSLCAMKVGTDGTLLGAWANGGSQILDIGTGTGLVALMMAQRFPESMVIGAEIDDDAVNQARVNVQESPFANRVGIVKQDMSCVSDCSPLVLAEMYSAAFEDKSPLKDSFDSIVSNPPYFSHSLVCPNDKRTLARHNASLTYRALLATAWQLLSDDGELSLIIPFDCKNELEKEAYLLGFFKSRQCGVRTTPRKQPRRYLLAFRKHPVDTCEKSEGVIETSPGVRSEWYQQLTGDFYL